MDTFLTGLPFLVLAATALGVLLLIALARNFRGVYLLTLSGFFMALVSLWPLARPGRASALGLLSLDRYTLFPMTLVIACGTAAAILTRQSVKNRPQAEEFFFFLLLATLGGSILVTSAHFAMLLLGLKLLSLSLCVLVGCARENALRIQAAMKLFVVGEVFSASLLFGAALIYYKTGTLRIPEALTLLRAPYVLAGVILVTLGMILTLAQIQAALKIKKTPFRLPATFEEPILPELP